MSMLGVNDLPGWLVEFGFHGNQRWVVDVFFFSLAGWRIKREV